MANIDYSKGGDGEFLTTGTFSSTDPEEARKAIARTRLFWVLVGACLIIGALIFWELIDHMIG